MSHRLRQAWFGLLLLLSTAQPWAMEKPYLRLNPNIHTGMLNRIAINPSETMVATVSDDKTVRLWELPGGRPLRVLRPPIGEGNEGKLFTVSFAPTRQVLATGGWAKGTYRGFGQHNIYLFDVSSGEILERLGGLDNVVLHLDFSPDGAYLVGALSGQNGIRVWNTEDWTELFRDDAYAGDSYWAEFSQDSQFLASTSLDGMVRLYSRATNQLVAKRKSPGSGQPFTITFSPNGQRLAVGFLDTSRIAILSAKDLSVRQWVLTREGGAGDLFIAAWGRDGKSLFAGGGYTKGIMHSILRWQGPLLEAPQVWPVSANTLMDLKPLRNQNLVFASATPSLGMLDAQGKAIFHHDRETVYFNRIFPQGLLISDNAHVVQFEHRTSAHKKILRFSLTDRRLSEVLPSPPSSPDSYETPAPTTPDLAPPAPPPQPKTLSVKDAQQLLMDKGHFPGPIDNQLGPLTQTALRKFQRTNQLPETGKLDASTIAALLIQRQNPTPQPVVFPPPPVEKPVAVHPPLLSAPNLELKSWKNSEQPRLNDQPLSLTKNDTSISYAFAPNGESFILGTRFRMYLYDKHGKEQWRQNSPGIVWAVNIAANGSVFVAAFSDGTIRMYRLGDGVELLALYPHADGRRWIAWTPEGYYAAATGSDKLLGWHLNNQLVEAADFYPFRSLRRKYYRPEKLMHILRENEGNIFTTKPPKTTSNETTSVSGKTEQPTFPTQFPPRVLLLSPENGTKIPSQQTEIKYRLRFHGDTSPPDMRFMVNGRPFTTIKAQRALDESMEHAPMGEQTVTLTLPPHDIELAILAENVHGVSPPEIVSLQWTGEEAPELPGSLYVLSVGISDYASDTLGDIPRARNDAIEFAAAWEKQTAHFHEVKVKYLENGSYADIKEGLDWLRKVIAEDLVLVFIAGHSLQHSDDRKNTYYFLPADASPASNTISSSVLMEAFGDLPAKVILFVDSANFPMLMTQSEKLSPADIDGLANDLSSPENGVIVFSSTVGTQYSHRLPNQPRGIFTAMIVEALAGKGDLNQDGKLMLSELDKYVSENSSEHSRGKQTPVLAMPETMQDFPLIGGHGAAILTQDALGTTGSTEQNNATFSH